MHIDKHADHALLPRRTLILSTALVLALHWLLLSRWPLAAKRPWPAPAARVFSTRSVAAAPPVAAAPAPVSSPRPVRPPKAAPPAAEATPVAAADQTATAELDSTAVDAAPADFGQAHAIGQAAPDPPPPEQETPTDSRPPDAAGSADATGQTADAMPAPVLIPAPLRLAYEVSGQVKQWGYSAHAELLWQHDGHRYEARQEVSALLVGTRTQSSVGWITPQGLQPELFSDRARSEQLAHFDHARGRVSFSANTAEAAVDPGAQDRLSILIQLGALLAADPERFAPGAAITLTSVSARSADRWTFIVTGPETLDLPAGPMPALKLQRLLRHERDQQAELWVAPALGHLPVRIRLTQVNGDYADLRLRSSGAP